MHDALAKQVVQDNWSVEEFCFHPALRNYQTQWLGGIGARRFAFIGVVERYEADIRRLSRDVLGRPLRVHRENRTESRPASDQFARLIGDFKAYHAADYALYERARKSADPAG